MCRVLSCSLLISARGTAMQHTHGMQLCSCWHILQQPTKTVPACGASEIASHSYSFHACLAMQDCAARHSAA